MTQVMARVESAIVEFELHVHVVPARRGIIPAFVQPISGGVASVDVDGDNHVVSAGAAGGLVLGPADLAARSEIRVQVLLVMSELVLQQVDVRVIDIGWRVKLPVVVRVVLIVLWIAIGWHNTPVGKQAVDCNGMRGCSMSSDAHASP